MKSYNIAIVSIAAISGAMSISSCTKDETSTAPAIYICNVYADVEIEDNAKLKAFVDKACKDLDNYSKYKEYTWSGESESKATAAYTTSFLELCKADEVKEKIENYQKQFQDMISKTNYGNDAYKATITLEITRNSKYIYPTSKPKSLSYTFVYEPNVPEDKDINN